MINTLLITLFVTISPLSAQIEESLQEKFAQSKSSNIAPCQKFYGSTLIDCMDTLNDEMFQVQLYLLKDDSSKRRNFFEKKLNSPEDYEKFYKKFKTDEDGKLLLINLHRKNEHFFQIYTQKNNKKTMSLLANSGVTERSMHYIPLELWR